MIKKNKLSLFLLAIVMMLSVYYVNMPEESVGSAPTGSENVVTRYPDFALSRIELLEEREEQLAVFEEIIGDKDSTDEQIDKAYAEMQLILGYTEKEVLAEKAVKDFGYVDCFVSYDPIEDVVSIEILNYTFSSLEYEELTLKMHEVFGYVTNVEMFTNQV